MRLFWIIHNNTCNTGRIIIEGLKKTNPEIENLASREDIVWLRSSTDENIIKRWGNKKIGKFPDSNQFIPELATPNFWNKLHNIEKDDYIIVTVNSGDNHNINQALQIIDKKNLYNRTIVLDEDESCRKWKTHYTILYQRAKIIMTGLGDRVHLDLQRIRDNVFFFSFNGLEDRYFPKEYKEKDIDVFFKSRVEGWLTPRIPFRDKLLNMKKRGVLKRACIMPEFDEDKGNEYYKLVSGDRYHPDYYDYLNRSKISVYLNGFNPIGYQFWESCANKCLILHQTPWRSQYYNGGDCNPKHFHWEHYNPPFIPGEDFYYFETPDDLENVLTKLLTNPELIDKATKKCHVKSLRYTSINQALTFLKVINHVFGN
jgi:hypothetical protein